MTGSHEVRGSNPLGSTNKILLKDPGLFTPPRIGIFRVTNILLDKVAYKRYGFNYLVATTCTR